MKNLFYLFLLASFLVSNLIAEEVIPEDNKKIYKRHSNRGFYNSEPTEYEKFLIQEAEKNKEANHYTPYKGKGDMVKYVAEEI